MENLRLQDMWAKSEPYQSLRTHALVCGNVAKTLYQTYLSPGYRAQLAEELQIGEDRAADFIAYLTSVHDIGKIDERFQYRLEDPALREKINALSPTGKVSGTDIRHERAGYEILKGMYKSGGLDRKAGNLYAEVISAHHQGKSGGSLPQKSPIWAALQAEFEAEQRKHFWGGEISSLPVPKNPTEGVIAALLLGPLILADWISSGVSFADAESWIAVEKSEERIRTKTTEFLKLSGMYPEHSEWGSSFRELWPNIPTPRPLQSETEALFAVANQRYALVLMEAPMGEGKTEAGLYAAVQMAKQWGKDGFYMALPTSATSNQMLGRMREFFALHDVEKETRLLHGMAWLVDDATPEWDASVSEEENQVRRWLSPLRRGLLSQYAVGTIDQAMMAATIVKYGVLRLLGLSEKVLVIDEIHSYDVFMNSIIQRLLEWCKALEIPVIMLSATLPPKKKQELLSVYTNVPLSDAYPLLTAIDERGQVTERVIPETSHAQTYAVSCFPILNDTTAIAQKAVDLSAEGGCVCVLMNTVAQSQEVYAELQKIYTGDKLLFHAQFPAGRRAELEKECIARYGKDTSLRPKRSILVATQVVEQSLDVDFDAMLTAVAPIDLLLQRMGRVHRHAETLRSETLKKPTLYVLVPEADGGFGVNSRIYPECFLRQSVRIAESRDTIRVPEDLSPLVSQGYDPEAAPPEEYEKWLEQFIEDEIKSGSSDGMKLSQPMKKFTPCVTDLLYDDGETGAIAVKTRLGEPTVTLALLHEELTEEVQKYISPKTKKADISSRKLAKSVLQCSISVRMSRLKRLKELLSIPGGKLLEGIWLVPLENGHAQTSGGDLYVDDELGLIIKEDKA